MMKYREKKNFEITKLPVIQKEFVTREEIVIKVIFSLFHSKRTHSIVLHIFFIQMYLNRCNIL